MNTATSFRRLTAAIAASLVLSMTLATVSAQDFQAIERRLGGAVEAGEISLHQAQVMLDALRHSTEKAQHQEMREREFAEMERDLIRQVEAGKIPEPEAERRLQKAHAELFAAKHKREHQVEMERRERKFAEIERAIDAAARAGRLSEKDAEKKLNEVRRQLFGDKQTGQNLVKKKYAMAVEKITQLVKAGQLSEDDAKLKLAEIKKTIFGKANPKGSPKKPSKPIQPLEDLKQPQLEKADSDVDRRRPQNPKRDFEPST